MNKKYISIIIFLVLVLTVLFYIILAEQCFNKAGTIVPSRLYPYYLLAKLYDEKGDGDRVCQMADFIQIKEAKVHSTAVEEIRMEMKSLCEKYKTE